MKMNLVKSEQLINWKILKQSEKKFLAAVFWGGKRVLEKNTIWECRIKYPLKKL